MSLSARRFVFAAVALCTGVLMLGGLSGATVTNSTSITFSGAFEFEGLAAASARNGCRGEGAFGVMKARARVLLSEQDAAGEFSTLGKGKIGKGDYVVIPPGVQHSFASIDGSIEYLMVRVDADKVLPAGFVHDLVNQVRKP